MTVDESALTGAGRHSVYTLDGSNEDLRRLVEIARVSEDMTRHGLGRSGLARGGRALDCGCGPLGALPILAEIVGSGGQVIGADSNAEAIKQAAATLDALGVGGVHLVTSDATDLDIETLGGPLDLIYTRCFLMHQTDPAATVGHLFGLLRPGGWLVCHEPLPAPRPWSHPDHDALGAAWDVLGKVVRSSGVAADAVAGLPAVLAEAGFRVEHLGTASTLMTGPLGFELHALTLEAVRARAAALDAALASQIDALAAALHRAAGDDRYAWVSTPVYLDVAARRPSQ